MYKPLLGPCDSLSLEPFAYPWAWEQARMREQDNWAPEEIPVAKDIALFKSPTLPSPERIVFLSLMEQLTAFDIQRGDDVAEIALRVFQPAEIKHFFKRLIWEEALHTRSYRYIIENFGIGTDIYDQWQIVPEMKRRIEFAQEQSAVVVCNLENNEPARWNRVQKQDFLKSLIFWFLIFEGIWFMLNLKGPLQSMARRGLFINAAEQFQYIARDEEGHVRFGTDLIVEFIRQYPETWTPSFKNRIRELFNIGIALEKDYTAYVHREGPILGYNVTDHVETAQVFANAKLQCLGLEPLWPKAKHRFPWMGEQLELRKEKNFFETRVTEYQTGGSLKWDD